MGHSVMVVEDEDCVRVELCELLQEEGYDVIAAADGEQALAALAGGAAPSLVVLDMAMPVMDGLEFLARLDNLDRRIEVVVATGDDTQRLPPSIPRLRKPFCVEPLLKLLEQRCPLQRGGAPKSP